MKKNQEKIICTNLLAMYNELLNCIDMLDQNRPIRVAVIMQSRISFLRSDLNQLYKEDKGFKKRMAGYEKELKEVFDSFKKMQIKKTTGDYMG